jgi:DNA-binding NtrC family response regulator
LPPPAGPGLGSEPRLARATSINNTPLKTILLVEDNAGDALRELLNEHASHRIELTHVECIADAEEHLAASEVDIILLDLGLPDVQGLDAVWRACTAAPQTPLVVLTGFDDESVGVQALHEGAQDFLVKGKIEPHGLLRSLGHAIETAAIRDISVRKAAEKSWAEGG